MIPTLIIVEDNKDLVEYLSELIKSKLELNVLTFNTGISAINYINANKPDVAVIDLMLEDIHGKTICEEIRKKYAEVPIIILTGEKSEESIVACLNAGADDYITKPFNNDEFIARLNSKIRNLLNKNNSPFLTCKDLTVDTEKLEVRVGNKKISLTSKELQLLVYLLNNKSRVCLRDKILFAVWGYTSDVDTRVVDVHIGKLRKKLNTKQTDFIESVRGFGYRMVEENS